MSLSGPNKLRSQRCHAMTGFRYSELCCLVAINAHYRVHGRPVTRKELTDFLISEEDIGCDGQIAVLLRARCIERRGNSQTSAYVPTPRGSQKIAAWRRVQVGEREPEGTAAE